MVVSEKTLKWALNFYPPLFFQRIWITKFYPGFLGVDVKISNSLLNRNYNGSIFGGTIFSATDPFYPILFDQLMQRRGFKVRVWLKSASIQYIKPGMSTLYFSLKITEEMIADAEQSLKINGKFVKSYPVQIFNKEGELCASAINEVYVRTKFDGETKKVAI